MAKKKQSDIDRLAEAIKYWRENKLLATKQEIKRVADRFLVHPKSLEAAIRLMKE